MPQGQLSNQSQQLFDKIVGRSPRSPEEVTLLKDVQARKGNNPQAVQGAIEFHKQQGAFDSSQSNASQIQPLTPEQAPTAVSAFDVLTRKMKEVDEAQKRIFTEQMRQQVRQEILDSPEMRKLRETRAGILEDVQTREFEIGGDPDEGVRDPVQAGALSLAQRGDLVGAAARAADSLRQREASVDQVLGRVQADRQQQVENAQQSLQNTRAYLQDVLAVNADQRAEKLNDLQIQKLKSDLEGGVISKEKLLELGAEFGPEGLAELQHSLGLPPTFPFAQGITGDGYQNNESTYYGTAHKGVDKMMPENTPLQSSIPMTITRVFEDEGGGLTVYGVDDQGTTHKFLHLNQALVNEGDKVGLGEVFALSGNTGELTTGAHLHYEITDSAGNNIDPRKYRLPGQTSFVSRREQERMSANIKAEDDLRGEYVKAAGTFVDVQQAYQRVKASGQSPSAAGDLSMIFSYMRLLDPSSVVRESEYRTAAGAAAVPDQLKALYNKAVNGQKLSDNQRNDFINRAEKLYESYQQSQSSLENYYRNLAEARGLDSGKVVVPYQSFVGAQATSNQSDVSFVDQIVPTLIPQTEF